MRAFELAADERSPSQFGWLGWRAITAGQFDDALVHFTAMSNRDQTVSWQIGLALATLARGRAAEAATLMERGPGAREHGGTGRRLPVV